MIFYNKTLLISSDGKQIICDKEALGQKLQAEITFILFQMINVFIRLFTDIGALYRNTCYVIHMKSIRSLMD